MIKILKRFRFPSARQSLTALAIIMTAAVIFAFPKSADKSVQITKAGQLRPVGAIKKSHSGVLSASTADSSAKHSSAQPQKTNSSPAPATGSNASTIISPQKAAQQTPQPPAATPPIAIAPTATAAGSGDYATESTCPGQNNLSATKTVLVCLTSYARAQHSAGAVNANSALMAAADAKVLDLINCSFSHTACGNAFDYWMQAKGYGGHCSAENIASGQNTPIAVFTAWMNSAGHKANILNPSYNDIGVAVASNNWVMELGGC